MRVAITLLCALGVSLAAAAADDWKQTTITKLKKDEITVYNADCKAKTEEPKLMKADIGNIKEAYVRPTGGCVRIVLGDRTVYVSETVVEHTLKKEAAACPPIVTASRDRKDNVSMGLGDGKNCDAKTAPK
jgi:hypothetical protein